MSFALVQEIFLETFLLFRCALCGHECVFGDRGWICVWILVFVRVCVCVCTCVRRLMTSRRPAFAFPTQTPALVPALPSLARV